MLSFMKEQGPAGSSMQEPTASDRSGRTEEQEYLTTGTRARKLRRTTYVLAVIFGAGLLCLLFMIKKATPQQAQAAVAETAEAQIEAALTRLTGIKTEIFDRMDGIVQKFYEFSHIQQIKVNELVKNPFERDLFLGRADGTAGSGQEDESIDAALMRRQMLKQQAKELSLVSIIRSEQGNCCMIDDRMLYEGDTIKDFKVAHIGESFVKLESGQSQTDKVEIILKLAE